MALTAAALFSLLPAAAAWLAFGRRLGGTTLRQAWGWSLAAAGAWWAVLAATALLSVPHADQLWYLAAVLMLCPFLAALGAKRPMSRVWTPFVILPLVLVLGWSAAASVWAQRLRPGEWQLDGPVLAGFGLVLLMAAGNYIGTRFQGPTVLWVVSVVLIVLPLSAVGANALNGHRLQIRLLSSMGIAAAAMWVWWLVRQGWRSSVEGTPGDSDRLTSAWQEFRDLFGIVWASRILDRMNELGVQYGWSIRLRPEGFVQTSTSNGPLRDRTPSPERSFRWLLRRFVDDAWLDSRLGKEGTEN